MKRISKIFEILLTIVTIVLVCITVYSLLTIKILKHDYINFIGYTLFEVTTGSMSSTIEIGDIIIVRILNNDINLNDIIVYKDGNIITHRVVGIEGQNIITKGDANNTQDKPISREAVIGKVIKIIPNVGIYKRILAMPHVYISIITTIILFTITLSYNKDPERNKNEKK